jgi:hypothetical protein
LRGSRSISINRRSRQDHNTVNEDVEVTEVTVLFTFLATTSH